MSRLGAAGRLDALVLDLDTRAGLATARSLGGSGMRLALGSRDGAAPGLRTRWGEVRRALPAPEGDFDAYADATERLLRERPADAVLCSIDSSLEMLHRRRESIGRLAVPAIASAEAVEVAASKERTLAVAAAEGVPVPHSLRVTSAAEASAAAAELGLPAVLKPDRSWLDRGAGGERVEPLYVDSPERLAQAAARLLGGDGSAALLQAVAPGERLTIKLFRADGRTVARFAMRVERCWPPLGGSSVMRTAIAPPADALGLAERLVAAVDLDGYSEVEFRRDADGRPLLMEVNARLSQSVELALRAGVDFPRLQVEWARGGRLDEVAGYRPGLRVGWLGGEARLLAGALLGSPEPRPSLGPLLRAAAGDYLLRGARLEGWASRDPMPLVGSLAAGVRALTRRGTRRPFRSPG